MKLRSLRSDHILALPLCIVALALPAAGCRDPEGGGGGSSGTDGTGTADDATSEPDGGTVDDTGTDSEDIPDIDVIPPPGGMRRLTPAQYVDSVGLMLGSAAADAADPPPLPQLGTFDSETASIEPLTPVDIEQYESSAMAIGTAVMSDLSGLAVVAPCVNSSPDAACYTTIAQQLGRYAWRRPLIDEEVSTLAAIGVAAQEWGGGDFLTGVRYEVSAILQSPNFLYVMEVGEVGEDGVTRQLDQYELASRMSFFLVGHTPDLALLDAAEAGSLGTNSEIEAVATELLDRPEARDRLSEFYGELYRLRDLETKGKDETLFPTFSPELAAAMRQETLLLIQNVVFEEQSSFLNIFDATYTFVNDDLAALYGMTPPAFPWQLVPLPVEQGRAGFLTQGAFLSVFSHPDINSPTRRGLFVQETLLCTDIQPPPPEVNPTPPAPVDGQTITLQLVGGVAISALVVVLVRRKSIPLPFAALLQADHEFQVFAAGLLCFGLALATGLLGLSAALGAFVAGLVVGSAPGTGWVHHALEPFRVLLVALFFVSVGLLVDLHFITEHWVVVGLLVLGALSTNTLLNTLVFKALGRPWRQALYTAAVLAQIGEFSFVLTAVGRAADIINDYGYRLAIATIATTLLLSPAWIGVWRAGRRPSSDSPPT